MQKIILFYKFVPIEDTETLMYWQKALCEKLGLKGRILISTHGINGTLGGDLMNLKYYTRAMKAHSLFRGIKWKWSEGSANDFPRLSVKVRDEIVSFGIPDQIKIDKQGIVGGGKHLKSHQVHELVKQRGDDVVFIDGRNAYEAAIGRFKNAIIPNTETTRDFAGELKKPELQKLKSKPIVTYCTGGIRCEILTVMMKNEGFEDVYQIDGGIAKYGQEVGDDGLWEGKMYVFDRRMSVGFSDKAKDIAECIYCQSKTSNYENCAEKTCNKLMLICDNCAHKKTFCVSCVQKQPASAAS